jgi:hypothetical protein
LREVLRAQDNDDSDDDAQDKSDDEAKAGRVFQGPFGQIKYPGWLIFVHNSNLAKSSPRAMDVGDDLRGAHHRETPP